MIEVKDVRGMYPGLRRRLQKAPLLTLRSVHINRTNNNVGAMRVVCDSN
jgi:hypothetical protein